MERIYLISGLTGCFLIIGSVVLLLLKRISLDKVGKNPNLQERQVKAEILNLVKFSSNIPALGLFLIGMVLIIVPVILSSKTEKVYTVKGIVQKENSNDSRDILIATSYPPHHPEKNGEIVGFTVTKVNGMLPTLSFNQYKYGSAGVNLNDREQAEIIGRTIKIKGKIILYPIY
jgi:hypothetical protein